jgi:hypothetical protein
VRFGDLAELLGRLRQGHIKDLLASSDALEQELHRQGGLARAGHAFDEEQAVAREAAAQDVVEAGDAGACLFARGFRR